MDYTHHFIMALGPLSLVVFFFVLRAVFSFISMLVHRKTGQGNLHRRAFLRDLKLALACLVFIFIAARVAWMDSSKAVVEEVTGTEAQRAAKVEAYLLRNVATVWQARSDNHSTIWSSAAQKPGVTLPGKIADPHFLYTSVDSFRHDGDRYYVSFRVPVADVDKWTAILEPIDPTRSIAGEIPVPPQIAWWVTDEHLSRLTFFDPRTLSGQLYGWVGVDRATGEIFVYSFTM
ncbi:MAG: hypothetical protein RIR45_1429 [Pseudomonadota bacterium]|jgi:hypothetical protein